MSIRTGSRFFTLSASSLSLQLQSPQQLTLFSSSSAATHPLLFLLRSNSPSSLPPPQQLTLFSSSSAATHPLLFLLRSNSPSSLPPPQQLTLFSSSSAATHPLLFLLRISEQFPDVGFRLSHVLVQDLGAVHDLGLSGIQHLTNLSGEGTDARMSAVFRVRA